MLPFVDQQNDSSVDCESQSDNKKSDTNALQSNLQKDATDALDKDSGQSGVRNKSQNDQGINNKREDIKQVSHDKETPETELKESQEIKSDTTDEKVSVKEEIKGHAEEPEDNVKDKEEGPGDKTVSDQKVKAEKKGETKKDTEIVQQKQGQRTGSEDGDKCEGVTEQGENQNNGENAVGGGEEGQGDADKSGHSGDGENTRVSMDTTGCHGDCVETVQSGEEDAKKSKECVLSGGISSISGLNIIKTNYIQVYHDWWV